MSRAQCIVLKEKRILMVKHSLQGREWWCLPGGGIEREETPEAAALRELREECCVDGRLIKRTSVVEYGPDDHHFTFFIEIGDQVPVLGHDPEMKEGKQFLADIAWLSLSDLFETNRVYLWTAGLLAIPDFAKEILL